MFRADVISIVAGGSSVRHLDLSRLPGTVIGVNDSFVHAECDICVSMDRLWTENRWAALVDETKPTYLRDVAVKNIGDRPEWLNLFTCDVTKHDLTEDWGSVHGDNSAFCALNLAYLARPKKIFLFGFDMSGGYWYPTYSWQANKGDGRFRAWAKEFGTGARQCIKAGIEVLNVSQVSQITAFKKISQEEALT